MATRAPQWWVWIVEHAPGAERFTQAQLSRILDVSRSVVHSSVRGGATVEWVVRTLRVLEEHGWPAATLTIEGGVMRVSASSSQEAR